MVMIFRLNRLANSIRSGNLAIVPSSFMISHITPAGYSPASLARSTDASVCPALSKTPPGLAFSGNTCPGLIKSEGLASGLTANFMVIALSKADMPVVVPYLGWASIETQKYVPFGSVFLLSLGEGLAPRISPASR